MLSSSSQSTQAAAATAAAAAAAATAVVATSPSRVRTWALAPWTSLLSPLLRLLSTWLRTRLLAVLPAPLHFVLGSTSRSLDALLTALALVLSAALAHQRLVPLIVQRILDTATLSLGALDMRVNPNDPQTVGSSITARLQIPGPPLATRMVARRQPMRIVYRGRVVAYAALQGTVHVPAGGGVVPMEAVMTVAAAGPASADDTLQQGFAGFCRDLVQATGAVPFAMQGEQVEIQVLGGRVGVPGLKLAKSVSLPGMGGLRDMAIDAVLLVDSTLSSLVLECTCSIVNPSSVSMSAGTVQFGMTTPDLYDQALGSSSADDADPLHALRAVSLADIAIRDMRLVPGRNTLTAQCTMRRPHPSTQPDSTLVAAGLRVLSRYLTGQPSDVVVFGVSADPRVAPFLTPAIQSVVTHTVLPPLLDPASGIPPTLLIETRLAVSQLSLVSQSVPARITLANPFPLGMTITRMRGQAYLSSSSSGSKRVAMGTLDANVMLYVPGNAKGVTPDEPVPMGLALGVSQLAAVAGSGGVLRVDVECEIDCRVGLCVLAGVAYRQQGVKVVIQF